MGHTNSTPNIGLPQFIGTDKPTWLGDVNGAMSAIDTKIGSIDAAIATTDAKADNAVADASGAVTTATDAVNTAGAASTTATQANNLATQALTVANNTADLCTLLIVPDVTANKTAIGTLADLTTTAKDNLVDAINEVAQGGGGGGVGTWTLAGTQTGSTPITEPTTYSEVDIIVNVDNGDNIMLSITIPKIAMASGQTYRAGHYESASSNSCCYVDYASGQFTLAKAFVNGSDKTSNSTISVYYR